jgi:recombination protein RecA
MTNNIDQLLRKKYSKSYYGHTPPPLKRIPTGVLGLDYIFGGGLPLGRFVELSAMASCGKTSTAIQIIKHLQSIGIPSAYLDLERTLDEERFLELGLTTDNFYYLRPSDGVEAIEAMVDLAGLGVKFIVVDSVPFLVPSTVVENEVGKIAISPQAKLISAEQSKLVSSIEQSQSCVFFINQLRDKIGGYGGGKETTGGNALKFLCSIRTQIYRKAVNSDGSGMTLVYKVLKNKTFTEGLTTEIEFFFESGLCKWSSFKNILELDGHIIRAGSYYKFSPEFAQLHSLEEKIGQGAKSCIEFLQNHPDLYSKLYSSVLQNLTKYHD